MLLFFYRNIKKTGKDSHVTVMETTSYLGLIELNKQNKSKPFLDIIFIDASHEAADVMSDGILSFPLLKDGGVMIFDDYIWEKLVQKHYQPKLAIDAFLEIMKPYVKIIKKGNTYQLIFYGYDPETQKSSKETSIISLSFGHHLDSFWTSFGANLDII